MKAEMSDERRAAMCEWAQANGLDPAEIDEHVQLIGDRIHYRQLVGTLDGQSVWEDRTAPLLADFPVDEYRISSRPRIVGGGS